MPPSKEVDAIYTAEEYGALCVTLEKRGLRGHIENVLKQGHTYVSQKRPLGRIRRVHFPSISDYLWYAAPGWYHLMYEARYRDLPKQINRMNNQIMIAIFRWRLTIGK